jgi:hypothetical protein
VFRVRPLSLLSLVAALSSVAMLGSSALAANNFEWLVNGKLLAEGQSRAFTVSTDGQTVDLSGTVSGATVLLLSNEVSVEEGAQILGGRPGTAEGTALFRSVTVDRPSNCLVESLPNPVGDVISTRPSTSQVVQSHSGEPLLLLTPAVGDVLAELRFLNAPGKTCALNLQEVKLIGSTLALPLNPRQIEDVHFVSSTTFLLSSGGGAQSAGLTFGGEPASLTGAALIKLTSGEELGVF